MIELTAEELTAATDGFHTCHKIGQGGCGVVFKLESLPSLPHLAAQPLAVKKLLADGTQGERELRTEIALLGACRHPNLMPLLGF